MEGNAVVGEQIVEYWAEVTFVWNARVGYYPGRFHLPIPILLGPASQKIHEPVTEGGVQTES